MSTGASGTDALQREIADLRQRLDAAESIVRAIDRCEVDAFLVSRNGTAEEQVLVLGNVDLPYRLLIERMQQGAATVSRDGTILYSNRRLAELVRSARPGLGGTALGDVVAPRDRAAAAALVERGCAQTVEQELSLVCEDGQELPVHFTVGPLVDQAGLTCLVVTDLSLQKVQERERERLLQERAARASAEHAASLLREADRRKDVFLAALAHELRNPLAPLSHGLHLLQLTPPDDEAFGRTHAILTRQVSTLVRLVDDLLDIARLTQGKIRLKRAPMDVRTAVERAVEACQTTVAEHGHRLDVHVPDEPLTIEADDVRVVQILTNLLNNAAKYTPPGGTITLDVERDAARREVILRVSDTGLGIPADLLARIFEPFAQLDPDSVGTRSGLGIGLTLARNLAEMHGGTLLASSDGPGHGSEFALRLPLAGQALREATPGPGSPASSGRKARVVIVDDNRDAAESLGLLLQRLGHEVRVELGASEALPAAIAFAPDLVLLDIGLPEMDGYQVARRLRREPRCARVFLVALSGFASEADRARALAAGFDEHRAKPIDVEDLQRLIERAVPRRATGTAGAQGAQGTQGAQGAG